MITMAKDRSGISGGIGSTGLYTPAAWQWSASVLMPIGPRGSDCSVVVVSNIEGAALGVVPREEAMRMVIRGSHFVKDSGEIVAAFDVATGLRVVSFENASSAIGGDR